MNRHNRLQKEITQRLNISDRTGDIIPNWTPNNVKSLVIGVDKIWVRYHVTGGKFTKLNGVVPMDDAPAKDAALLASEKFDMYKPVLKALLNPRVCSAIEEIVFCTEGYPRDILALDTDLTVLLKSNMAYDLKSLLGRFPRLRSVTQTPASYDDFLALYSNSSKEENDSTLCELLSPFLAFTPIVVITNPLWYTQKPRKSDVYTMDAEGSTLLNKWDATEKRLVEVAQAEIEAEKQRKLAISRGEIQATPAEDAAKPMLLSENDLAKLHALNAQAVFLSNVVSKLTAMYNSLSLYDASEWGYVVKEKEFIKALKLEYHTMFAKKTEVSLVSFARILSSIDQVGKLDGLLFLQYVYDAVNLRQIGKSKDIPVTTLSDVQESIASLEEFTQKFAQITYARVLKSIFYYYNMYGVMRIPARILPHHANKLPSLYITRRESRMMAPFPDNIGAIANALNIPYLTNGEDNIPKLAAVVTIATDILTSIK